MARVGLTDRVRARVGGRTPEPPPPPPPPPPPVVPGGLDVERENLRMVVDLLQRAGVRYFVVPTDRRTPARLGIRAEDLPEVRAALAASGPDLAVSVRDGDRISTTPADEAADLDVPEEAVLLLHTRPGAPTPQHVLVEARPAVIEPWRRDGSIHRAILPNTHASAVDLERTTWTTTSALGVGDLPTLTDLTGLDVATVDYPVDAVILWADGSDLAWHARRAAAAEQHDGLHRDAVDESRFRDFGELRYALRSLDLYAPWLRRVFLVTDGQRPDWLAADQDRVVVVDHSEVFGAAGVLPTFNSHAISARMHHVPGLAEHFLYLNDDVFFGRPVMPEQWFDSEGFPLFHATQNRVPGPSVSDAAPPIMARRLVADLVERDFGRRPHQVFQHGPHPLRRSTLLELEQRYPELVGTWSHPFRRPDDIEVVWLHNYVGYLTGRARPARGVGYGYYSMGLARTPEDLEQLLKRRHKDVFCINDESELGLDPGAEAALGPFLATYFPTPASFEVSGPGSS
jgi:Stealth protein CR2, conserved region 2/Stealth protein CR3, conserved region 3/Stealth protein CR4, conserved region 4